MESVLSRLVEAEPLPSLRNLALAQEDEDGALVISLFWTDAPERTDPFLRGIEHLYTPGLHFSWESPIYRDLVSLTIRDISIEHPPAVDDVETILRSCPRLDTLCLNFYMNVDDEDSDDLRTFEGELIILKYLRTLKIKRLGPSCMAAILCRVVTPSLNFFSITAVGEDESEGHQEPLQAALAEFFVRQTPGVSKSLCPITRFHIREVAFVPSRLADLFRLLPLLIHSRAIACNVDALVLAAIQSNDIHLDTLHLEYIPGMSRDALIELAERKAEAGHPLKRLVVRDCNAQGI